MYLQIYAQNRMMEPVLQESLGFLWSEALSFLGADFRNPQSVQGLGFRGVWA